MRRVLSFVSAVSLLASTASAESTREAIAEGLRAELGRIADLEESSPDVEVYAKGVIWALMYDATHTPADYKLMYDALAEARRRLDEEKAGRAPWATAKGKVVRGFVSAIDGSVQPYGAIVPKRYDPAKKTRLDVVLHGSTKPVGISELRFMSRFAEPGEPPDVDYIEIHPLGRVENGYRWAGETDVYEAIEAACRAYNVDRDRIVLRGMSMGASGTWHLGLKRPDVFVALGPYCGYVDTREFSRTPLPNFVKVGALPHDQDRMLHLLDSVDYAANAGIVPVVACMGEKDVFFQAHVLMGNAMKREGLELVNLISPGTGHVIDPVTHKEQMRRIGEFAERGLDRAPRRVRFVTWSLRYPRSFWVEIQGLARHYERAEIDAELGEETIRIKEPVNVSRFALTPPKPVKSVTVGGLEIPIDAPGPIVLARRGGRWVRTTERPEGKSPGLQGPIDDAFTGPFLCVRGTGTPWNPAVKAWTDRELDRFAAEWARYFRGDLRIKTDAEVTPEDVSTKHLILFGDPGSNPWIAKVLPGLSLTWTRERVAVGPASGGAADHVPTLIHPNPLAPGRYVVLNGGHTFGERELSSLNYLLFPRAGDWILREIGPKPGDAPETVADGIFDESWRAAASKTSK